MVKDRLQHGLYNKVKIVCTYRPDFENYFTDGKFDSFRVIRGDILLYNISITQDKIDVTIYSNSLMIIKILKL